MEYLRSFGLFGLWQLWQSSGPGGRVHFMIAEKSSDVKVKRVSRLAKSKARHTEQGLRGRIQRRLQPNFVAQAL